MAKAQPTKVVELYDKAVNIEFYGPTEDTPNRHYYKLDGERLISVTAALGTLNKPGLMYWAVNMACEHLLGVLESGSMITKADIEAARRAHREKTEEAANIGTQVHKWAEDFISGRDPEMPEDKNVLNGVTAFLQWIDQHNVEFVSSERLVYSRKHGYVGHMDAEARIDGKLCVVDFKTSNKPKYGRVYPEWLYQTAAYQKAAQEEGTRYDGKRHIVRFDKETGNFDIAKITGIQQDWYAFLAALQIKKREKSL